VTISSCAIAWDFLFGTNPNNMSIRIQTNLAFIPITMSGNPIRCCISIALKIEMVSFWNDDVWTRVNIFTDVTPKRWPARWKQTDLAFQADWIEASDFPNAWSSLEFLQAFSRIPLCGLKTVPDSCLSRSIAKLSQCKYYYLEGYKCLIISYGNDFQ
jgi:hypothetical protein